MASTEPAEPSSSSTLPTDPSTFDSDDRISFSTLDSKFLLVLDGGSEFEFDTTFKRWIPLLDEALVEQQSQAYAVQGVDETETVDSLRRKRKAKPEYVNGEEAAPRPKKQKPPPPPRENKAIYVTGLPLDVTVSEVAQVFSHKCGMIAENVSDGTPRIKLYTDPVTGAFKGDCLIVFFKAPSVQIAITLLDDTHFRITENGHSGRMRVQPADESYKKVQVGDTAAAEAGANGEEKGNGNGHPGKAAARNGADKAKIIKKTQKLESRLADWDDDAEPSAIIETSSRWDKVVILKHMFTLEELDEDPAALLDIKEDVREDCESFGEVTNVVLFDLEPEGVVSVRFANAEAARACVARNDGRSFAGRTVQAGLSDGREQFLKSKKVREAEEGE